MNYLLIKRIFDIIFSFFVIITLIPILIIIIVIIRIGSEGPLLFVQTRIGYKRKVFKVFKFRTMFVKKRDESIQINLGNKDIIPLGGLLRRFKLDELPQLINVLKGDMSLVGPRPFIIDIYERMPNWAKKRYQVKPGLTGLAQTSGGIKLKWEQKWEYDITYTKNISFLLDIRIILKTIFVVLLGEKIFVNKNHKRL
tara:strand:+ start:1150 stop:1740 length:591 start_codon:yes stop_codon:yes gene_type:complete